ncbi:MAG: heparinase II/III family protein [Verrucomicrobiota bacterium]
MWQSLDEAVNLIKYVQTARFLGDFATLERKAKWKGKLFKPNAELLERTGQTIQNIPCWQRSAEAVTALYCNDEALWNQAVNGPFGIRSQVTKGISDDYIWYEQSMGYNAYVVLALVPFFREALVSGRGESLRPIMEAVENLMLAPMAMRFPNGQVPNPADSGKAGMVPDWAVLLETADIFPTRLSLQKLSSTKNWMTLLDSPAPDSGGMTLPPVVSRKMEATRFAILHAAPWQVYLHFGQLGNAHAQAEALNYEAFYDNTDVTHDPGTVGYGSPLSGGYYRKGVCANMPLVDGLGQEGWHPGRLDKFSSTSVTASQPLYRKNAEASRTLTINGNQLSDTATIRALDQKNHALGFVLNLQGKVRLPEAFADNPSFGSTWKQTGFEYWTKPRTARFKDKAVLFVDYKGLLLRVELKLAGEFTLTCSSAPDYPPARRDALYLEAQGQTATLETRFSPMLNQ